MSKVEKYIVIKPLSMGLIRVGCPVGTIVYVDRVKSTMTINGTEYKDIRDLDIALKINGPVVVPYDEKNVEIEKILESVKSKLAQKEVVKAGMPIVMHDSDLKGEIDISYTKIRKAEKEKKDASKMEIIKESENTVPIEKRIEDDMKAKIEAVYNRPKMKVIKEGEDSVSKNTIETAKAKTKSPKPSISLRR